MSGWRRHWPGELQAVCIVAAVIADVTREKLVQTDADLGPAAATDTRKVAKIVQALSCEADALIAEMEQELAEGATRSADPETLRATRVGG